MAAEAIAAMGERLQPTDAVILCLLAQVRRSGSLAISMVDGAFLVAS
jgi:hypothetical protein